MEDNHQVPGRRGEAVPVHAQHYQPCISNTNGMGGDGTDLPASVAQYLLHQAKKGQVKAAGGPDCDRPPATYE